MSVSTLYRCCGFWDNSVKCYSLEANCARLLQTIHTHTDVVTCLAISPDNTLLVTGSNDSTVMIWDFEAKSPRVGFRDTVCACPRVFLGAARGGGGGGGAFWGGGGKKITV